MTDIIDNYFGFEVSVIVRTHIELQIIFDACPFSNVEKVKSYSTSIQLLI